MRKLYILFFFMVFAGYAQQQPFITTWETYLPDTSMIVPVPEDSNYTVDFGDGTILTNQTGPIEHIYSEPGIYTVALSGNVKRIVFNTALGVNYSYFKSIEQWGDIQWTSMENAFKNCVYMTINATDAPDLTNITSLRGMFWGASSFNQSINHWDVSTITDMSLMFMECAQYNQPLDNWDVSNVTTMFRMFQDAVSFNQPLDNWDVSNVTDMSHMFSGTLQFNQPLDNWDVGNVTSILEMFYMSDFNQPLNNWNVSAVTNMIGAFSHSPYNYPLDQWDVSNVTTMNGMFISSGFNQPISNWDVSNVTDMSNMFSANTSFNQPLNTWDMSGVTNISGMFSYECIYNQPLDNWNVSNVTDMSFLFLMNNIFNQNLNNWDVSGVVDMREMFSYSSYNRPLNNWDVSSVLYMMKMFYWAHNFSQDLSGWEFNNDVILGSFSNNNDTTSGFIAKTAFTTELYDALLFRFAELQLHDKVLNSGTLKHCDAGLYYYLNYGLGWVVLDGGQSQECQGNNLLGTMRIDANQNGCDANDSPAVNFMVQAINNNNFTYSSFVNNQGTYKLNMPDDIYTVTPVNVPDYFTVTPPSAEVTFTGFGNSEALNFCLVPNQSIQDVNVTVLPIGDARPGFESEYKILIENIGTQSVASATVTLTFDNTLQSFVSAVPAPAATSNNQLTFSVGNLGVFATKEVNLTMATFVPPVVNGGEVATFTANVTPDAGDNTPDDNTFILNQTIVNSFDPNDKRVVQGEEIYMEQAGEYLDYIIRFQNTGTASAITVRVEDTLSDNLDWATLKPIAASHAYRVEVTEGNKVNFIFNDIFLPHEEANPEGSNGYIAYKVKPKQGIQLGDVISGNAGIYFDYNLPIITNTVTTTVVAPLGVKQNAKTAVSIYPNPAGDVVHLQAQAGTQVQQVSVYNLQGSQLMSVSQNQNPETLNISSLSAGVYLLQVNTNTGRATCRLVKK